MVIHSLILAVRLSFNLVDGALKSNYHRYFVNQDAVCVLVVNGLIQWCVSPFFLSSKRLPNTEIHSPIVFTFSYVNPYIYALNWQH